MKNLIIGLIIGLLVGATTAYAATRLILQSADGIAISASNPLPVQAY